MALRSRAGAAVGGLARWRARIAISLATAITAAVAGVSVVAAPAHGDDSIAGPALTATAIATGANHSCAVLSNGAVRCWGLNSSGQLGLGNTNNIGDDDFPVSDVNLGGAIATAVAAGSNHTCALLSGGAVRCWGDNTSGQLGLGNTVTIGDNESPTTNVNLGGAVATAVAAGGVDTCALLATGAVRCWGNNAYGQVGIGNTNNIGDNENPTTDVNLGVKATAISVGAYFACAILVGGAIRCWGNNNAGQLGIGNTNNIGDNEDPTVNINLGGATATALSSADNHSCAVLIGGVVRCWGYGPSGQLGVQNLSYFDQSIGNNEDPTENVNIGTSVATATATGSSHSCAVVGGGTVRCWGYNGDGQLGVGYPVYYGIPPDAVNLGTAKATLIAGGSRHTCVLLIGGAVRCWGLNAYGQLGIGNTNAIGDNESPTADVGLLGDTVSPTVTVATPTPNQAFTAGPIRITGNAKDNNVVSSVRLAIYRNVAGGQYWNGSGWQSTSVLVSAGLTALRSTDTNWVYTFAAPPGGVFYLSVFAIDGASNVGTSPWQTFSITDSSPPTVSLTSPTLNQAFATRPVTITGTAADNVEVGSVQVAIYRPGGAGQFWNGAAWQTTYTTVAATLSAPGAATTGFTYNFDPPQSGGLFYAAAIALDTSNAYALTPFTPFTLPDSTPPVVSVSTPADQASVSGSVTVAGAATDNSSVASVSVVVYRASTAQFFNGTTWQSTFATMPTVLSAPGEATTVFVGVFVPPAPGTYLVGALAIDGSYNYTLSSFNTITAS